MPKRRGATSKRQTASNRHKVDRKKRENKRDLKKAAKAMRSTGLRIRPKKQRERAKMAISLSSKDPNKERALTSLLKSRERAKTARQERRQSRKDEVQALGQQAFDEQQKPDALWMHPVTANQLDRMHRHERREVHLKRAAEEQERGVRRYAAFPPGSDGAGTAEVQLRKIISSMRDEVPAFLITLDSRCALECVPWSVVDDIIADAVALHNNASEEDKTKETVVVVRRIFFALTRADLVTADSLVSGAVAVAQTIKERYMDNEPLVAKLIKFNIAACSVASAATPSVNHFYKALISVSAEIVNDRRAKFDPTHTLSKTERKELNKVMYCVYGYPNTGRTALEAALQKKATNSACAIIPASQINEIVNIKSHERRFEFEDSRVLTLVNVGESRALSNAEIIAGDVLFHKHSTTEKMPNPEMPAQKFLDEMSRDNFNTICRAFGQGSSIDGKNFLVNLGRCIRREGGFYTPHGDDKAVVPSIASGIYASNVEGAEDCKPTLRAFHQSVVHKRDGSNAMRIGARVFLNEFCRGVAGFRWYSNTLPQSVKKNATEMAVALGSVFSQNNQVSLAGEQQQQQQQDVAASRRRGREEDNNKKSLHQQQETKEDLKTRGLTVVQGLQQVASTLPLASVGSVGMFIDAALVSPQAELLLGDEEISGVPPQDLPPGSDDDVNDEDEDDDEGILMGEDEFGEFMAMDHDDDELDNEEDFVAEDATGNKKSSLEERKARREAAKLSPSRWDKYSDDDFADEDGADFWMPDENDDDDEEEDVPPKTSKNGKAAAVASTTTSKKDLAGDFDEFDEEENDEEAFGDDEMFDEEEMEE